MFKRTLHDEENDDSNTQLRLNTTHRMVNHECHTKLTPPCGVTDTAPQTAAALFELHLLNIHQQRHTL